MASSRPIFVSDDYDADRVAIARMEWSEAGSKLDAQAHGPYQVPSRLGHSVERCNMNSNKVAAAPKVEADERMSHVELHSASIMFARLSEMIRISSGILP